LDDPNPLERKTISKSKYPAGLDSKNPEPVHWYYTGVWDLIVLCTLNSGVGDREEKEYGIVLYD